MRDTLERRYAVYPAMVSRKTEATAANTRMEKSPESLMRSSQTAADDRAMMRAERHRMRHIVVCSDMRRS